MGRCDRCGTEGSGSGVCHICQTAVNNTAMIKQMENTHNSIAYGGPNGTHVLYGDRYECFNWGLCHLVEDLLKLPFHLFRLLFSQFYRLFACFGYMFTCGKSCNRGLIC
jgi:hypothetical protein